MQLETIGEDEDYYYYQHPVAGKFGIRKDVAGDVAKDSEYLNKELVGLYAGRLKETGNVPDNWTAFSEQFKKEVSSTARGLGEIAGTGRTSTYEQDFLDEVYLETNPVSGWTGMLTGAVADPVTFPFLLGKLLKLGRIGTAALGGGVSGVIQPEREEFGLDRLSNTAYGAAGGAVIGGAISILARRMGYDSPEALQKAFDDASVEGKKALEEEVKSVAQTLADKSKGALTNEFEENLKKQQELTQQMLARQDMERQQFEDDFQTSLDRIQGERVADEFQQNLDRIQREGANQDLNTTLERAQLEAQFRANLNNVQAVNAPKNLKDQVRADMIAELGERIQSVAGTAETGRVASADVRAIRNNLRNVESMLNRALDGKKTKLTQDQLIRRRADLAEDLENAIARRDATKTREQNVKDLVKLKKGEATAEYNRRVKAALEEADLPTKVDVPKLRPPVEQTPVPARTVQPAPSEEVMQGIRNVINRAPEPEAPAQMTMPARPIPEAVSRFQEPVIKPMQAGVQNPLAPPALPTLQPKSLSSAGASTDLPPSTIRNVLNMNTGSRAAQSLPEARAAQSKDLTDPQERRQARLQEEEARLGINTPVQEGYGLEGGRFTDRVLDEDTQMVQRAIDSAIRDGEVSSAAEYLMMRWDETGGALSLGEQRLVEIASAEARAKIEKVSRVIRSVSRQPTTNEVEAFQQAQMLSEQMELFNRLREFERMGETAKGRAAAALRSYRKTNELARDQIERLREGRIVTQLFFGVNC